MRSAGDCEFAAAARLLTVNGGAGAKTVAGRSGIFIFSLLYFRPAAHATAPKAVLLLQTFFNFRFNLESYAGFPCSA
jgi:hypothetical protein